MSNGKGNENARHCAKAQQLPYPRTAILGKREEISGDCNNSLITRLHHNRVGYWLFRQRNGLLRHALPAGARAGGQPLACDKTLWTQDTLDPRNLEPKTLGTDDEATSIVPTSLTEALSIPAVHSWYHWSTS
jgi:hypothetical protein